MYKLTEIAMSIEALNHKFGIGSRLTFEEDENGLTLVKISNNAAKAVVSLYGAHVLSYQPTNEKEVLWLSRASKFEVGTPIRGGIPLCFPWFGPHPEDASKPAHGFARLAEWSVCSTSNNNEGETTLELELTSNSKTKELWPYDFYARLTVTVGEKLKVDLSFKNTGDKAFTTSDALHSYFNISTLSSISIDGLANHTYYDGFEKEPTHKQEAPLLTISKEENRRYINHSGKCTIADQEWNRSIGVEKLGSNVTVVWNPWQETTKTIGDIEDADYINFICVEAANAYNDSVTLQPSESHQISTIIAIE